MSEVLLAGAVVVAALFCPAMMWWSNRRGKTAACCLPPRRESDADRLEALQRRHNEVSARLASLEAADPAPPASGSSRV